MIGVDIGRCSDQDLVSWLHVEGRPLEHVHVEVAFHCTVVTSADLRQSHKIAVFNLDFYSVLVNW
jgi:hypothetical protein